MPRSKSSTVKPQLKSCNSQVGIRNKKPATCNLQPATGSAPSVVALIAGGGAGTRMNSAIPKQFLELRGQPILLRTVHQIASLENVIQIVIALPAAQVEPGCALLSRESWRIPIECVRGGTTRQESVRRALSHASRSADLVLVHDAVRPLCDLETMRRTLDAAWKTGGAVPGLPATETIQRVSRVGRVLATPPREELFAIQTPQCFRVSILRDALSLAHRNKFVGTDESSVVRWAGHSVFVVPGSPANIKITRPLDLKVAELLLGDGVVSGLNAEISNMRIGQGIDYHCLVEGRRLILGGVDIPFDKGLEGHSDADALSHAICDAVLGAAALGDIGHHFSNTDPAQKGRNSLEFLREARFLTEKAGYRIVNIDATLLCQRPKLAPYMDKMKENIAGALGLRPEDVSIKATTTEGMNAEGRGEGISVQAIALLATRQVLA